MNIKKLDQMKNVKKKLAAIFEIVDMSSISFYLGLKIEKTH